jgi:hypothetical protein
LSCSALSGQGANTRSQFTPPYCSAVHKKSSFQEVTFRPHRCRECKRKVDGIVVHSRKLYHRRITKVSYIRQYFVKRISFITCFSAKHYIRWMCECKFNLSRESIARESFRETLQSDLNWYKIRTSTRTVLRSS